MTDSYQEDLRRHSYEKRYDPLRDAARRVVALWYQEDGHNLAFNDLSGTFWTAMAELEMTLKAVMRGGEPVDTDDDVPEVEVTSDRSHNLVVPPQSPPAARRSGAKNISDPHLQEAFISEARTSMGQPTEEDCRELLDRTVTLTLNASVAPVTGVLTRVIHHPSSGVVYLVLDDNGDEMYTLNSVQAIKVSGPRAFPSYERER